MSDTMSVYRILQQHTGAMNIIVIKVYNGEITAEEALDQAEALNNQLATHIKKLKTT